MNELVEQKRLSKDLDMLKLTKSAEESKKINNISGPCIILAGAGMCNGGRIVHHLKHNLPEPKTSVIIAGYQAYGTLGRRLVNGDEEVRIHGEMVPVEASVHTLGGFSAHAGQTELIEWFGNLAPSKPKLVLTHGENKPRRILCKMIKDKFGIEAILPKRDTVIEL